MTDIMSRQAINQGQSFKSSFVPKEQRQAASNAFRATHFTLGNAPNSHQSTSSLSQVAIKKQRPHTASNARSAALMQGATNFKLGQELKPAQQYSTVYASLLGSIDHSGPKQTQGDVFAKKTSIDFGGRNKAVFSTTQGLMNAATQFELKNTHQPKQDKSFIAGIKANHFDYGDVKNCYNKNYHYQSVSKNTHNHKGDASKIKPKIDAEKMKDLRQQHFNIGGPTAAVRSSSNIRQFRPMTANVRRAARPTVDPQMKANLTGSHWTFSGGNPYANKGRSQNEARLINNKGQAGFVTSNMLQFQWVQPYRGAFQ